MLLKVAANSGQMVNIKSSKVIYLQDTNIFHFYAIIQMFVSSCPHLYHEVHSASNVIYFSGGFFLKN